MAVVPSLQVWRVRGCLGPTALPEGGLPFPGLSCLVEADGPARASPPGVPPLAVETLPFAVFKTERRQSGHHVCRFPGFSWAP